MAGRYEKKKEPKGGGWKKALLISLVVLVVLIAAVAVGGVVYYNHMLDQITHVDVPKVEYTTPSEEATGEAATESTPPTEEETEETTEEPTEPPHVASKDDYVNILVVGQAARGGEEERFADSMILFTLNKYEKKLIYTSMLRDAFTKMPDYKGHLGGRIKLTTIYHLGSLYCGYENKIAGSMELMDMALFNNFGIEVDHNFEVDFDVFVHVINALGGVDIEITQAESDYLNADDFWVKGTTHPGMQHMTGLIALSYARMRKAEGDADSDIVRTSRQRKMITAILEKLKTQSPLELQKLAETVLPMIATSMTKEEITEMLLMMIPMLPELTIEAGGTCPANYHGEMVDIYKDGFKHSVLRFDEASTKRDMRLLTLGEGA